MIIISPVGQLGLWVSSSWVDPRRVQEGETHHETQNSSLLQYRVQLGARGRFLASLLAAMFSTSPLCFCNLGTEAHEGPTLTCLLLGIAFALRIVVG